MAEERITNDDGTEKMKGIIRVATMDNVSVIDLDKQAEDKLFVDDKFKEIPNSDRGGYIPPKGVSVEEATQPKVDERVTTVKELRMFLHSFQDEVQGIEISDEREQMRYKALAVTNIELSRMWMGRLLSKLDVPYPYVNSMNPENKTVDPATDIPDTTAEELNKDSLIACKQSRVAIENVTKPIWNMRKDFANSGKGKVIIENIYTYLGNAKMYIGWLMVKIKEELDEKPIKEEIPEDESSVDDLLKN